MASGAASGRRTRSAGAAVPAAAPVLGTLSGPFGDALRAAFVVGDALDGDRYLVAPPSGKEAAPPVIEVAVDRERGPCVVLAQHTRTGRFTWWIADADADSSRPSRGAPT